MRKILISTFLFIAILVPSVKGQSRNASQARSMDLQKLKLDQFYEYLNAMYVDTLDNGKIVEEAIKKMLEELDPHSSYSSAEEMKSISETFEGSFSGIGIEFDVLNDTLIVVNTVRGGPSESVGMLPNDKIMKIDGMSAVGISRAEVPKKLRGTKGTRVEIEVMRKGVTEPLKFRITRDNIPIHTVDAAYKPGPDIGYIRVNRFAENTMSEFTEAYKSFGKIDALILDLRGNGGGLMDQAIRLSEFFLPSGSEIVSMEGRATPTTSYTSRRNGTFLKGPLVILIDSGSASGSEIVAGAIQDWDRGIIVGQPSFGKGLVQRQVPLIDGSAVRITTARYHTPTGRVIQRPYDYGKAEEYYLDHLKRAMSRDYADSLNAAAPVYMTLKSGREVLGGGGIFPDIYIPMDTTKNYSYWNRLVRAGVINQYINGYLERERTNLQRLYPHFENFEAGYEITPAIVEGIAALGREQGIEYDKEAADESMPDMRVHIKALVAQKLWDTNEYFKVINGRGDPVYDKALEVVKDWPQYQKILE